VREATCTALAICSNALDPELFTRHEAIMTAFVPLLDDPSPKIKVKASWALDFYVPSLTPTSIEPYLEGLIEKVRQMLAVDDLKLQENALALLASIAEAASTSFKPYGAASLEFLLPAMSASATETLHLRARATEAVGIIAQASGREAIETTYQAFMNAALESVKLDFNALREASFGLFSNFITLLKDDFEPYMPALIEYLVESLEQLDFDVSRREDEDAEGHIGRNINLDDDEDEDEDDGPVDIGNLNIRIETAVFDEKATAAQTLGVLAEALGGKPAFQQVNEKLFKLVCKLAEQHTYEGVRANAIRAAACFTAPQHEAIPEAERWSSDKAGSRLPLPASVAPVLKHLLDLYFKMLANELHRMPCARIFDNIADHMDMWGPAMMDDDQAQLLFANLVMALQDQLPCQTVGFNMGTGGEDEDLEGVDEDDEDGEGAPELMTAVTACIESIAEAAGPAFAKTCEILLPLLGAQVCNENRSDSIRGTALACVAQLTGTVKEAIAPYAPMIYGDIVMRAESETMQNDVAFLTGLLFKHAPAHVAERLTHALSTLQTVIGGSSQQARDNGVSALAHVLRAHPDLLAQDGCFDLFLAGLPLKSDLSECQNAYSFLLSVLEMNPSPVKPAHLGNLVAAFGTIGGQDECPEDVRRKIGERLRAAVAAAGVAPAELLAGKELDANAQGIIQQLFA